MPRKPHACADFSRTAAGRGARSQMPSFALASMHGHGQAVPSRFGAATNSATFGPSTQHEMLASTQDGSSPNFTHSFPAFHRRHLGPATAAPPPGQRESSNRGRAERRVDPNRLYCPFLAFARRWRPTLGAGGRARPSVTAYDVDLALRQAAAPPERCAGCRSPFGVGNYVRKSLAITSKWSFRLALFTLEPKLPELPELRYHFCT
jgi:hypothetical protein